MPGYTYTVNEYQNMTICYALGNENLVQAQAIYLERYGDRPSVRTILGAVQRWRDFQQFRPRVLAGARQRRSPQLEEDVLAFFELHPMASTQDAANVFDVCEMWVWRLLRDEGLCPFHFTRVQELFTTDYDPRVRFCNWLLADTSRNILWTDECTFMRAGLFNIHNSHYWSHENPRLVRPDHFQRRFSVNVWAGILGEHVLGPVFLERLNAVTYMELLQGEVAQMLEEVPLRLLRNMYFQQDGAPAHYAISVRQYLTSEYGAQWIGRGGPVEWPPRSCDITPLDFFLWGHVKDLVYGDSGHLIENIDDLKNRIRNAFDVVKSDNEVLRRVNRHIYKRARKCILQEGRYVQQLIVDAIKTEKKSTMDNQNVSAEAKKGHNAEDRTKKIDGNFRSPAPKFGGKFSNYLQQKNNTEKKTSYNIDSDRSSHQNIPIFDSNLTNLSKMPSVKEIDRPADESSSCVLDLSKPKTIHNENPSRMVKENLTHNTSNSQKSTKQSQKKTNSDKNTKLLSQRNEPKHFDKHKITDVRLQNNPENIETCVGFQRSTDSNKHKNVEVQTDVQTDVQIDDKLKLNDSEIRLIRVVRQENISPDDLIVIVTETLKKNEENYKMDQVKKLIQQYSDYNKAFLGKVLKSIPQNPEKDGDDTCPPPDKIAIPVNAEVINSHPNTRKIRDESIMKSTEKIEKILRGTPSTLIFQTPNKRPLSIPPENEHKTATPPIAKRHSIELSKPLPPTVPAAQNMTTSLIPGNDQLFLYEQAPRPQQPMATQEDPFDLPHLTHQYNPSQHIQNQTIQQLPSQVPNTFGSYEGMPLQMVYTNPQKLKTKQPNPIVNTETSGSYYYEHGMEFHHQPSQPIQQDYQVDPNKKKSHEKRQTTNDIIKYLATTETPGTFNITPHKRLMPSLAYISELQNETAESPMDQRGHSFIKSSKPLPPTVQAAPNMRMSYASMPRNDQFQYHEPAPKSQQPTAIQQNSLFFPRLTHQFNPSQQIQNQTIPHMLPSQVPYTFGSYEGIQSQMSTHNINPQKPKTKQPNPIVNTETSGSYYYDHGMGSHHQPSQPINQQYYPNTQWQNYQQ